MCVFACFTDSFWAVHVAFWVVCGVQVGSGKLTLMAGTMRAVHVLLGRLYMLPRLSVCLSQWQPILSCRTL